MSSPKLRLNLDFQAPKPTDLSQVGGHILFVDDNQFIRDTFKKIISDQLHFNGQVSYAADGIEAVQIFQAHKDTITLIFMDINMPNKDGKAATREIRTLEKEGRHVPIFCISDQSDITSGWKEAGMDKAIGKVLSPRRIMETIQPKESS